MTGGVVTGDVFAPLEISPRFCYSDEVLPFRITPHYYLIRSSEICWKCHRPTPVFAFGASGCDALDEDYEDYVPGRGVFLMTNIRSIPAPFIRVAVKNGASIELRRSRTADTEYYMNLCRCGAPRGDYFMFNEPGHGFFPTSELEAGMIHVRRLNAPTTPVEVYCQFIDNNLELVLGRFADFDKY